MRNTTGRSAALSDLLRIVGEESEAADSGRILGEYGSPPMRGSRVVFDCRILGGRLEPLNLADRRQPFWAELAKAVSTDPDAPAYALRDWLVLRMASAPGLPLHMLALQNAEILRILAPVIAGPPITSSELRVLKQLIVGMDLSSAAILDGVNHETKRSQFKSLARKFSARSQAAVVSRILPLLLLDPRRTAGYVAGGLNDYFMTVTREFIPSARFLHLSGTGGADHRYVDLGPKDGRPVAFVHPQILPDFREMEIDLLHAHGLRLIVPLRNGAVSHNHEVLPVAAHLDHACEAIDLIHSNFTGDRLDIIACVSGCAYAIEYAGRSPDRVRSLAMVGAPVQPVTDRSIAGRLRRGLFSLGARNWDLMTAALRLYGDRIARPATFHRLLLNHYAPSLADLAIVEAEYASPHCGERGRKLFASSMDSVMHDFHHQMHPRWDRLPLDRFPIMFLHGSADFIHPIKGVCDLARSLGKLPVHEIEHAGQLLYHQHFSPLLARYASHCREAAVSAANVEQPE